MIESKGMVRIRLRRMGAKKQPTYRFVVSDARSPRDGRFIEILGHYNPRTEPKTVVVNQDKAKEWISKGAQPSDPVRRPSGWRRTTARPEN